MSASRADADMPGLALVDDVDVPGALQIKKQALQHGVGAELAEPRHLEVGGITDAVRARQRGGIPQRPQVPLMLHAARQAGDPQRRRAGRGERRELVGDLVQDGGRLRADAREPEARGAGRRLGQARRSADRTALVSRVVAWCR